MRFALTTTAFLCACLLCAHPARVSAQEDPYVEETDPLVREKLERWQDLKLGLLLHWGPYSQWGVVESWSLCSEDEDWCNRRSIEDYGEYAKAYEALQTTFHPVEFDPERWARAAWDAGMRYVVFTTKHHDGFSMFDTRQTDYRITSPRTPFASDPRADVTRGIFDAFRGRGFMVGAYFSKPDWHSPDYWWPYFATPDRYPNYDVRQYPERWARFVDFTHAQIRELMSGYGPVDILWLDGGWVRTRTEEELLAHRSRPGFRKQRMQSLDLGMPGLVGEARELQPGLIVVDRAVPGPYQNYLTPEARVPDAPIAHPWEVPMPMATSWSYVPDDPYKAPRELVHMLVDVVAKGGNLLLNVGPGPDGRWHDDAYDRMAALGAWLRANGEGIYGTRATVPYGGGNVRMTRGKDGSTYAFYLADEGEEDLPASVALPNVRPAPDASVTLLGSDAKLAWDRTGDGVVIRIPSGTRPPASYAWGFRISAVEARPVPYRDPALAPAERARDLVGRMTLDEKFWQLYMSPGDRSDPTHDYVNGAFGLQVPEDTAAAPADAARAHALRINRIQRYFADSTRLGIPIIPFDEALHGLARRGATAFPQAIGLAATWDAPLVGRVAGAVAAETRARGIRQVLSPVVNIADDVRWGRVEETYGEDPFLASAMAAAFTRAFEDAGVVATPKHFVANVGAGGRDSYAIQWNERRLEDLYFPPFKAAIRDGGARSLMTAYNSVDGVPATQSRRLLTDKLRSEWGFGGFVVSDAAATGGATVLHMTEPDTRTAAKHAWEAGLDVVFQSNYAQHAPYLDAVRRGLVADSVVDAAVTRVLRAKFELGLFEEPDVDPDRAARVNGAPDHLALAREAARASVVLLHNRAGALPFAAAELRSLAVIGADAVEARLGGYSGPGFAPVSILDAVRARLPAGAVRYAPGPGRTNETYAVVPADNLRTPSGDVPGLRAEYFDNPRLEGEPRLVRTDERVDFLWTFNAPGPDIPRDWYSVRWTGTVTAPAGGLHRLGVEGKDGYRLWVDDVLVVDDWVKRSYGSHLAAVDLEAATTHRIRLEYFETTGNTRVRLVWDAGVPTDGDARIAEAVEAAGEADAAVVVAGLEEGEFRDRAYLGLPGRQEELIRAVAATGTPVVVVIVGGSAVTMPWLDGVGAVLMAWYPGEQGGPAVADVLLGDASPAGRLPLTFPVAEGQLPLVYNHEPTGRGDDYVDLTGRPLFPFGHGLSYTRFEYSDLSVEPSEMDADGTATVRLRVRNAGGRNGDEVVQLYVRDALASVVRPVLELKGFTRIHIPSGEEREVVFTLGPRELEMLDAGLHRLVEPGVFRVLVGASSEDIRLRGEVRVR